MSQGRKIRYETEVCGRCCGSGRYSYNSMDGDLCYGCGGNGKTYTKAGRRAKLAVAARRMEVVGVPVETLQPGGHFKNDSRNKGWRNVCDVAICGDTVTVTTLKIRYVTQVGTRVLVPTSDEQWKTLTDYARTLDGCTVIEKLATAAAA